MRALILVAGAALAVDDGTGPVDLARFALAMRSVAGGDALGRRRIRLRRF